jgi:hypothetical protein
MRESDKLQTNIVQLSNSHQVLPYSVLDVDTPFLAQIHRNIAQTEIHKQGTKSTNLPDTGPLCFASGQKSLSSGADPGRKSVETPELGEAAGQIFSEVM